MDLGWAAAVTDRGLRHRRNEDDFALATAGDRAAVVVCDGVSSTANPDLASTAAAAAVMGLIEPLLGARRRPTSDAVATALHQGMQAAAEAVAGVPQVESGGPDGAPSTTIVAAWADPGRLIVVNVGDSRAYWLAGEASRTLSQDDSWAESAIAGGVPPADAYAAPGAHVITAWVGADGPSDHPHLVEAQLSEPGILLVCTDGLWNYFQSPSKLAAMVGRDGAAGPVRALEVARTLCQAAIDAGGGDNITAAVVVTGPAAPS